MIAAIVIAILAVAALAYVVRPVGAPSQPLGPEGGDDVAEEQKHMALEALVDLEDERDSGKLTDAEFKILRERYESEALAALRALDSREKKKSTDDELEREIAQARERMRCPSCGARRVADTTTCAACGSPLS